MKLNTNTLDRVPVPNADELRRPGTAVSTAFPRLIGIRIGDVGDPQDQQVLAQFQADDVGARGGDPARVKRIALGTRIKARHVLYFSDGKGIRRIQSAEELSARHANLAMRTLCPLISRLLADLRISPQDVDSLAVSSVTGSPSLPGLASRSAALLGLGRRVSGTTSIDTQECGWAGCGAGVDATHRVRLGVLARPLTIGIAASLELCSLHYQTALTTEALISNLLFSDSAGALVIAGSQHPLAAASEGPKLIASQKLLIPGTEDMMAWSPTSHGSFSLKLSPELPALIKANVGECVSAFLAQHGLGVPDVQRWIVHPGGPSILRAFQTALGLRRRALDAAWDSLRERGNSSSAAVFDVLARTVRSTPPAGTVGLVWAPGPGLAYGMILLEW